ncbi:hypothetical protein SEA_RITA_91 [Mycobacterium phage Rita]|nr:hypothetical protein SEA_RITA_91 [Mycobacterium phage Rita]
MTPDNVILTHDGGTLQKTSRGLSVILASQARFLTESPVCPACFQPRTEHSTDCKGHHK